MISENDIVGIIYPLRQENYQLINRIKEPVYVKFITHTNSKNPTKLKHNNYILFYQSGKNKTIVGYSKIISISFKKATEIKNEYLSRIQMNENDFCSYVKGRESKLLLFLELDQIMTLEQPVELSFPITMAGQYITKNDLRTIINIETNDI